MHQVSLIIQNEELQRDQETQHLFEYEVINFIPAKNSAINSLVVDKFTKCLCDNFDCNMAQCVLCLTQYSLGTNVVKLRCGHRFDHKCIVKWLETSHIFPICRYQLPN